MRFKVLAVAVVVLGLSVAAWAADINGKWTSEMAGMGGGEPMKITYNFKVTGNTFTGTSEAMGQESPVSEGKIDGDNISFVVTINMGQEMKLKYKGKIAGDEIKLTMEMDGMPGGGEGGGMPPMPPTVLKRAK